MAEVSALRINGHVARLNRYLPFSAAHEQIYEEYQTGEDSLDLYTVALEYAQRAIEAGAKCIVLTGDAGHGKTHLCRRLIELVLGYDVPSSRAMLRTLCDASNSIEHSSSSSSSSGRPRLRIHKDFSELDPLKAASMLEQCADRPDEVLVVCANEGRLRAIVQSKAADAICHQIIALFENSFSSGLSSTNGIVHIVNLNYQSVSALPSGERAGLLRRTLQSWVGDGRRWQACTTCSLVRTCPVRGNRTLLADDEDMAIRRISRLEEMFEAVERLGQVITIREMLMLVAYLVTGGLRCEDVHQRAVSSDQEVGWQHPWSFYNLLFTPPPDLADDRLFKAIPVLNVFRRLDPGAIATRAVDDKLLNLGGVFLEGQLDLQFRIYNGGRTKLVDAAQGLDDFIGNPQNKAEQAREAETASRAVRALRRRSVFDDAEAERSLMARLGFRHGDEFLAVIAERLTFPDQVRLKNLVISGFHSLQGLRMPRSEANLHLVDPAFGRATDDAAIIARRIPASQLQLLPARRAWPQGNAVWSICDSVDWIDRTVVIRVQERDGGVTDIGLDLLSFECVTRSASGYVSEDFYAPEIRRIRAFLGKLAAQGHLAGSEIMLFMDGRVQGVSIDMGVIQVGGV
jgi:hypothetical protein